MVADALAHALKGESDFLCSEILGTFKIKQTKNQWKDVTGWFLQLKTFQMISFLDWQSLLSYLKQIWILETHICWRNSRWVVSMDDETKGEWRQSSETMLATDQDPLFFPTLKLFRFIKAGGNP